MRMFKHVAFLSFFVKSAGVLVRNWSFHNHIVSDRKHISFLEIGVLNGVARVLIIMLDRLNWVYIRVHLVQFLLYQVELFLDSLHF